MSCNYKVRAEITKREPKLQSASSNYKARAEITKRELKVQSASSNYKARAEITEYAEKFFSNYTKRGNFDIFLTLKTVKESVDVKLNLVRG